MHVQQVLTGHGKEDGTAACFRAQSVVPDNTAAARISRSKMVDSVKLGAQEPACWGSCHRTPRASHVTFLERLPALKLWPCPSCALLLCCNAAADAQVWLQQEGGGGAAGGGPCIRQLRYPAGERSSSSLRVLTNTLNSSCCGWLVRMVDSSCSIRLHMSLCVVGAPRQCSSASWQSVCSASGYMLHRSLYNMLRKCMLRKVTRAKGPSSHIHAGNPLLHPTPACVHTSTCTSSYPHRHTNMRPPYRNLPCPSLRPPPCPPPPRMRRCARV